MPKQPRYIKSLDEWSKHGHEEGERLLRERGPARKRESMVGFPLPGPPSGEWLTVAKYVLRQGRAVIKELYIVPSPDLKWDIPPEGLTAKDLRGIPIRQAGADWIRTGWIPPRFAQAMFMKAGLSEPPPPGRTPPSRKHKGEDFWAGKANEYLNALQKSPRAPLAWLEADYKRRGEYVTRAWIRDWVHGTRVRGFLSPGRPGRPGAEPTEKLRKWNKSVSRAKSRRRTK